MTEERSRPSGAGRATISGWGNLEVRGWERRSENLGSLTEGAALTRGLGRSYGDASLPAPGQLEVVASPRANRILEWNSETGYLRAEAGLSVREIARIFLPRGFFVPVTPGTQDVTLGGMVAADVHGKNHHVDGCFGGHVQSLLLRVADGSLVFCSPDREAELFRATVGGMGLTGHILEIAFCLQKIPSPWILEESFRLPNVDRMVEALAEAAPRWPFTVCWLDALSNGRQLGRGVLIAGRWAEPDEAKKGVPSFPRSFGVPLNLPSGVVGLAGRPFNALYYHKSPTRPRRRVVSPASFFYPLDIARNWNRFYGKRGLIQYQCILPRSAGSDAARRFLEELQRLGGRSLLAVLKDCGDEGVGLLSFPCPGISLALDLPVDDGTQELVDRLNEFILQLGGRIYLAKDAMTRPEHFRAMEPRLDSFLAVRRKWDPENKLGSAQSFRLFGG